MNRRFYINVRMTQKAILRYLADNPNATIDEIARAVDCHHNTVTYNLKQLIGGGYVERVVSGKGFIKSEYRVIYEQNGHSTTAN